MSRVTKPAAARGQTGAGNAPAVQPAAHDDAAQDAAQDAAHEASLAIQRRHTTVAQAGVQKPAGVPASAFEAGRLARQASRKARGQTSMADLADVAVEDGVPIPEKVKRDSTLAYEALLGRMQVGQSVLLPTTQARYLQTAAKKRGFKVTLRQITQENAGVWCLGRPAGQAGGVQA